jgi:hypothetical protein
MLGGSEGDMGAPKGWARGAVVVTLGAWLLAGGCAGGKAVAARDAGATDAADDGAVEPDGAADGSPGTDAATDGAPGDAGPCVDPCPHAQGGVTWGCEKRFMYGMNYAWLDFATDFGGLAAWSQTGVAGKAATVASDLADMRAHGASVIRWWVFPDFRGDGIAFSASDSPTGLGTTVVADLNKALELADQAGVYVMLTLFSFDAFNPSADVAGAWTPGLKPILTDSSKRAALMQNVVVPFARAVRQSPYSRRVIAWDVINEPEWAMTGASPYGDEDYTPIAGLDTLTHSEMEAFIVQVIGLLRQETPDQLVTVGSAGAKWGHAWKLLDTDFYQLHMYKWVNDWWPYTMTPAQLELDDKPLVMGELPMDEVDTGIPYSTVLGSWWSHGYSGALGWQYNEATATELANVKTFADLHLCETRYGVASTALLPAPRAPRVLPPGFRPSLRRCHAGADGRPVCRPLP